MASISERDGSFRVQIRKKGVELTQTFSKIEDAELWAKWKEDIIDQMEAFKPPMEEMVTFEDAIDLKIKKLQEEKRDHRTIGAVVVLKSVFQEMLELSMLEITFDMLLCKAKELLKSEIRIGGKASSGGRF